HGGGWRSGSKDGGQWSSLPASYAAKGYVCISVNYRLTGDGGGFPACVHDVKNAVRWFRANAEELGLDPNRIGAYGNSAGAHLVSMLGLVKPGADLEGDGTFLEEPSLVQAVCASATPSDFLSWKGEPFPNRGFLEGDEATLTERATAASPISHVAEEAPPFLLIHAKDDKVVPFRQGEVLAEKLKSAGAGEVEWMTFEKGGHGVFSGAKAKTHPAMEAFFAKALKLGE
ncbi:MAG: alpha/beta hydrolase, partial [Verrucomicrobiales bacterium]|nr:alpha/beta hydrolase [Verrucomicrobiales bacterium]